MNLFDPRNESLERERLEQFQLERLQALLARLKRNVRRYRETLGDVRLASLEDLAGLPVTEPDDLTAGFPYGMFALPLREVMRLHSIVGPSGKQLVIGHTRNDLTHWGRLVARQFSAIGINAHDVMQIYFAPGAFEAAFGFMRGAETIEASVAPDDPFHIEYQLATLINYRVTVLITTPGNAFQLAALMDRAGRAPQDLPLRHVVLSRPVSAEERERLRSDLFADVTCAFGVDEILNPGLCVECAHGRQHVNEDQFLVETRDSELLVTTLCREAMPLLRYATRIAGDLCREECPCGRTGIVVRPRGRLDNRLLINETPLYREQIETVLAGTAAANHDFTLETSERGVVVSILVTADLFRDTMRELLDLKETIIRELAARLGIPADVRFRDRVGQA